MVLARSRSEDNDVGRRQLLASGCPCTTAGPPRGGPVDPSIVAEGVGHLPSAIVDQHVVCCCWGIAASSDSRTGTPGRSPASSARTSAAAAGLASTSRLTRGEVSEAASARADEELVRLAATARTAGVSTARLWHSSVAPGPVATPPAPTPPAAVASWSGRRSPMTVTLASAKRLSSPRSECGCSGRSGPSSAAAACASLAPSLPGSAQHPDASVRTMMFV